MKNEERSMKKLLEACPFFALIGSQTICGDVDIYSKLLSITKNRKRDRIAYPHRQHQINDVILAGYFGFSAVYRGAQK